MLLMILLRYNVVCVVCTEEDVTKWQKLEFYVVCLSCLDGNNCEKSERISGVYLVAMFELIGWKENASNWGKFWIY